MISVVLHTGIRINLCELVWFCCVGGSFGILLVRMNESFAALRKRAAETGSVASPTALASPERADKKVKFNESGGGDASAFRSMELALQSAIGGDALPIPQLLSSASTVG